MRRLYPAADVYTLIHDRAYDWPDGASPRVRTSFLNSIPGVTRCYPQLLPLLAWAARRLRLPPVELVLCSDAALAKAMTPDPQSKVVCYCHSPPRYAWDLADVYRETLPRWLRPLWGPQVAHVRDADRTAAQRVDQFIANSKHVAARIQRSYGRDAVVIYPPVNVPDAPVTSRRDDYYLCVGHHVRYKRLDLALEACRRLGRRLVVIGDGPDVDRLQRRRWPNVQWLGRQSDAELQRHYRTARGLLFPGEEDFGIVPVEALANGCPVIALGVGGATETVTPETGILFAESTPESLAEAIRRGENATFDPVAMHAHARQFRPERFRAELAALLARMFP